MKLPKRNNAEEDKFVSHFREDANDPDLLILLVEEAMDQRRPRLAARLVQCLSDQIEIPPGSALERAERAATMFLMNKPTPGENSWSVFEDEWRQAHRLRIGRAKDRMRRAIEGKGSRLNRLGRPRRRSE